MLLGLLQSAPLVFAIVAVVLLYSLALHELGHAWVADKVGDKTARNLGRVTLNPLKHLDPIGTLLLLVAGFGWAKPVPIQPGNFRNYRLGMFLVAIAGVVVNFFIALAAIATLGALGFTLNGSGQLIPTPGSQAQGLVTSEFGSSFVSGLLVAARINLVLVVFNLLPVPPLDGSKVLQAFLPAAMQRAMWGLERYGFFIVIAILLLFDRQVFGLINWVTVGLMRLILG